MTAGDMFERGTVWKCTRCGGVALTPYKGQCVTRDQRQQSPGPHQWEKQT